MANLQQQQAAPKKIRRREQMQLALTLRKKGASYEELHNQLGVSKATAHRLVQAALAELDKELAESAAEVRRLMLETLDTAKVKVMGRIERGDMNAVHKLVLLEERRAKLLGLDAPAKVAQTTPEGEALPPALDLSKLSDEQLAQLESIYAAAGATATEAVSA